MRAIAAAAVALLAAGCATPLEVGERLYREGDRLGALETWRAVSESDGDSERIRARIAAVEAESHQLAVRYKKRASYFEQRERLAESILDYRLALKLRPDDASTLERVQHLARELSRRKAALSDSYRSAFDAGDLAGARDELARLRALDPFDPVLETEERQLGDALRAEVLRSLAEGRRGFGTGDHVTAERAFRRVLALDPDDESARGYLAYMAAGRRELRGPGAQEGPERPDGFASDAEIRAEGFHQNALASERAGDLYAAIHHDLRALRAHPGHGAAARHLAELRRRLVGEVEPLIEAGRRSFRNEDLRSALDQWRRAQLIDPENERVRAYVARAERQIENLERLRSEPEVAAESD